MPAWMPPKGRLASRPAAMILGPSVCVLGEEQLAVADISFKPHPYSLLSGGSTARAGCS